MSGAIAVYEPWRDKIEAVYDMPVDERKVGREVRRQINVLKLAAIMRHIKAQYGISMIAIEKVHSSPQMGLASAFKFGYVYGCAVAVCETMFGDAVTLLEPTVWKRRVFCGARNADHTYAGRKKSDSVKQARLLFGNLEFFKLVSKDGRAEAALMAWYAAKTYAPQKEVDPLS